MLPLVKAGVSRRMGGGASPALNSCGASVCFRKLGPLAKTTAVTTTAANPKVKPNRLEVLIALPLPQAVQSSLHMRVSD